MALNSSILRGLEIAWEAICREHPELPVDTPIYLIRFKRQFMAYTWKRRIFVSDAVKGIPPEQVLGILLHEAAHLGKTLAGQQSRKIHDRGFGRWAFQYGLAETSEGLVYSQQPSAETITKYADAIEAIRLGLADTWQNP